MNTKKEIVLLDFFVLYWILIQMYGHVYQFIRLTLSVLALQMMDLWSFGTIAYTVNVIAVNLKVSFTRIILSWLIEEKELWLKRKS